VVLPVNAWPHDAQGGERSGWLPNATKWEPIFELLGADVDDLGHVLALQLGCRANASFYRSCERPVPAYSNLIAVSQ
jgi:hypothetical protein